VGEQEVITFSLIAYISTSVHWIGINFLFDGLLHVMRLFSFINSQAQAQLVFVCGSMVSV
jgi:hypothetical protein